MKTIGLFIISVLLISCGKESAQIEPQHIVEPTPVVVTAPKPVKLSSARSVADIKSWWKLQHIITSTGDTISSDTSKYGDTWIYIGDTTNTFMITNRKSFGDSHTTGELYVDYQSNGNGFEVWNKVPLESYNTYSFTISENNMLLRRSYVNMGGGTTVLYRNYSIMFDETQHMYWSQTLPTIGTDRKLVWVRSSDAPH